MQENFELRIREIAKLKKGWSFGKGEPFNAEHVEVAALVALRYYKKYALTVSGTPSEDGTIDLMFNIKDVFIDLIILPSITDITVKYDFKNCFQTSPLQYLHKIRIQAAKDLLIETDMKVHEISYEVGYENVNHFIAHFKKFSGTTPTAYRCRF